MVDADEDTYLHAGADNLGDRHVHHGGQFVGGNKLGHPQRLLVFHFVQLLLFDTLMDFLTFLTVVFRSLGLAHGAQTGQGVANLLFNFSVVNFYLLDLLFGLFLVALAGVAVIVFLALGIVAAVILLSVAALVDTTVVVGNNRYHLVGLVAIVTNFDGSLIFNAFAFFLFG